MPQSIDLVTDLPADFEVFGQAVATSMADLLGGTTGQILSKASNTDMDFTWTSANPGDITGVTAGVGISGGGTSGDVTVTNSMATAIDAKGDLIAGTGADAFARLGVGANDTVLTADSTAATGLKWAAPASGGMTLISTTSLTGASVTLSSIPSTYVNLFIVIQNLRPVNDGEDFKMQFNADATANRHIQNTATTANASVFNRTNASISGPIDNGASQGLITVTIPNYANTTTWKMFQSQSIVNNQDTPTNANLGNIYSGFYNQTSAISSLAFFMNSGNMTSGTVLLYGVK